MTKDSDGAGQYIFGNAMERSKGSGLMEASDQGHCGSWERSQLTAIRAGDESAWRRLYEQSFPGLFAYVKWCCRGNQERTEEVVQETWLTAVQRKASFDPERGNFLSWLCGIAFNKLRSQYRQAQKQQTLCLSGEPVDTFRSTGTGEEERRQNAELVVLALAALPSRYRAALRAKYFEGQTVDQIAAAWNETAKSVESLLVRARSQFRKIYLAVASNDESL